jgi:hypothetical protein
MSLHGAFGFGRLQRWAYSDPSNTAQSRRSRKRLNTFRGSRAFRLRTRLWAKRDRRRRPLWVSCVLLRGPRTCGTQELPKKTRFFNFCSNPCKGRNRSRCRPAPQQQQNPNPISVVFAAYRAARAIWDAAGRCAVRGSWSGRLAWRGVCSSFTFWTIGVSADGKTKYETADGRDGR